MQQLENARGEQMILPKRIFVTGFIRPVAVPIAELLNGNAATGPPVRRPARGTLRGTIVGTSYQAAQAEFRNLMRFLDAAPLKLRLHGPTSPYLEVSPESLDDPDTTISRATKFSIPLVAPDPLWRGDAKMLQQEISTNPTTIQIMNPGLAVHPVITLTGRTASGNQANRPKLTNLTTGQSLEYIGNLAAGQVLVLDCERITAMLGAVGMLNNMSNEYLTGGFSLVPGVNEIRVNRNAPTANVHVRFDYAERWP